MWPFTKMSVAPSIAPYPSFYCPVCKTVTQHYDRSKFSDLRACMKCGCIRMLTYMGPVQ